MSKTIIFDSLQHYIHDIQLPGATNEDDSLIGVEVTQKYAAFLTQIGKVWLLGQISNDQEDNKRKEDVMELKPSILSNLPKIVSLSCSKYHAFFLSSQGHIYSYGYDRYNSGVLGQMEQISVKTPRIIQTLTSQKMVSVITSEKHAIALNDHGNAFVWGSNTNGQLGIENVKKINNPVYLGLIEVYTNKKIAATLNHSIFITKGGKLFLVGSHNQIGIKQSLERNQFVQVLVQEIIPKSKKDCYFEDIIIIDENLMISLTTQGEIYVINKWYQSQLISGSYEITQISASKNAFYALTSSNELLEWDILQFKKLSFVQGIKCIQLESCPPTVYQLNQKLQSINFTNYKNSRKIAITYRLRKAKPQRKRNNSNGIHSSSCLFDGFTPLENSGCMQLLDSYIRSSSAMNRSPSRDVSYINNDYDLPNRSQILNQSIIASLNKSPFKESPSKYKSRNISPFQSQLNSKSPIRNEDRQKGSQNPSYNKGINSNKFQPVNLGVLGQNCYVPGSYQSSNQKSNIPSSYLFGKPNSECVSRKVSIDSIFNSNGPKIKQGLSQIVQIQPNIQLKNNSAIQQEFNSSNKSNPFDSCRRKISSIFGDIKDISRNSSQLKNNSIKRSTERVTKSPDYINNEPFVKLNQNKIVEKEFNQRFDINMVKLKQPSPVKQQQIQEIQSARGRQMKRNNNFLEEWSKVKPRNKSGSSNNQQFQNLPEDDFNIFSNNFNVPKDLSPISYNNNYNYNNTIQTSNLPQHILDEMKGVQEDIQDIQRNIYNEDQQKQSYISNKGGRQNLTPDSFVFPQNIKQSYDSYQQNINPEFLNSNQNSGFKNYQQFNEDQFLRQRGSQEKRRDQFSNSKNIGNIDQYIYQSQKSIDNLHRQQIAIENQIERQGSPNKAIRIFTENEDDLGEDNETNNINFYQQKQIFNNKNQDQNNKIAAIKNQLSEFLGNYSQNSGGKNENTSSRINSTRAGIHAPYQSTNNSPSFGQSRQNSQNQRQQIEKINRIREKINQIQQQKSQPQEQSENKNLTQQQNQLIRNKNRSRHADSTTYINEDKDFDMSSLQQPSVLPSPTSSNFLSPPNQGNNLFQPYFPSHSNKKINNQNPNNMNYLSSNLSKKGSEISPIQKNGDNSSPSNQNRNQINNFEEDEDLIGQPLETNVSAKERQDTIEHDLQSIQSQRYHKKGVSEHFNHQQIPNSQYLQFVSRKGSFQDSAPLHTLMTPEEMRQLQIQQQNQQQLTQLQENSSLGYGNSEGGYGTDDRFTPILSAVQDPNTGLNEPYRKQSSFWSDIDKASDNLIKKDFKKLLDDQDISGFNPDNLSDKQGGIGQGVASANSNNNPYSNNFGQNNNNQLNVQGSQQFDDNSMNSFNNNNNFNNNFLAFSRKDSQKLSLQPHSFIKNPIIGDSEDQEQGTGFDNQQNQQINQKEAKYVKNGMNQSPSLESDSSKPFQHMQSTQYQTQISSFPQQSSNDSVQGTNSNQFNLRQAFTQFLNENPDTSMETTPRRIEKKVEELRNKLKQKSASIQSEDNKKQEQNLNDKQDKVIEQQQQQSQSQNGTKTENPLEQVVEQVEQEVSFNKAQQQQTNQKQPLEKQNAQESGIKQINDENESEKEQSNESNQMNKGLEDNKQNKQINQFQVSSTNPLSLSVENMNSDRQYNSQTNQLNRELFKDEDESNISPASQNKQQNQFLSIKGQDMPFKEQAQSDYDKQPDIFINKDNTQNQIGSSNDNQENTFSRNKDLEKEQQDLLNQIQKQEQFNELKKKQQASASIVLDKLVIKRKYYTFKRINDYSNEVLQRNAVIQNEERLLVKQRESANIIFRKLMSIARLRKQDALNQLSKVARNKNFRNKSFIKTLENILKQHKQRLYFEFFVNCQKSKAHLQGQYTNALRQKGGDLNRILESHLQKRFLLRWKKNSQRMAFLMKQMELNKNVFKLTLNNFSKILKSKFITRLNQAFDQIKFFSMAETKKIQYEQQQIEDKKQYELQNLEYLKRMNSEQKLKNMSYPEMLEDEQEIFTQTKRDEQETQKNNMSNTQDNTNNINQGTLQTAYTSQINQKGDQFEEKVEENSEQNNHSEYQDSISSSINVKQDDNYQQNNNYSLPSLTALILESQLQKNKQENNQNETSQQPSQNLINDDKSCRDSNIYDVSASNLSYSQQGSKNKFEEIDQDEIKGDQLSAQNEAYYSDDQDWEQTDGQNNNQNQKDKQSKNNQLNKSINSNEDQNNNNNNLQQNQITPKDKHFLPPLYVSSGKKNKANDSDSSKIQDDENSGNQKIQSNIQNKNVIPTKQQFSLIDEDIQVIDDDSQKNTLAQISETSLPREEDNQRIQKSLQHLQQPQDDRNDEDDRNNEENEQTEDIQKEQELMNDNGQFSLRRCKKYIDGEALEDYDNLEDDDENNNNSQQENESNHDNSKENIEIVDSNTNNTLGQKTQDNIQINQQQENINKSFDNPKSEQKINATEEKEQEEENQSNRASIDNHDEGNRSQKQTLEDIDEKNINNLENNLQKQDTQQENLDQKQQQQQENIAEDNENNQKDQLSQSQNLLQNYSQNEQKQLEQPVNNVDIQQPNSTVDLKDSASKNTHENIEEDEKSQKSVQWDDFSDLKEDDQNNTSRNTKSKQNLKSDKFLNTIDEDGQEIQRNLDNSQDVQNQEQTSFLDKDNNQILPIIQVNNESSNITNQPRENIIQSQQEKQNTHNELKQEQSDNDISIDNQQIKEIKEQQDLEKQNNSDQLNPIKQSALKPQSEEVDNKNNASEQLNEQITEKNEQKLQQSSENISLPKQVNASQTQDLDKQNNQDSQNYEENQPQESSLKIQSEEVNKKEISEQLNEQITENNEQQQQQSSENMSPLKQSNLSQSQDLDKLNKSDQLNPQNNQLKQSPLKTESEEVDNKNNAFEQLNEQITENSQQQQQQSSEDMSIPKQVNASQTQDLDKQNNQDSQNYEKNQSQESPLKLEFEQADKENNASEQLNEQITEKNEQKLQQSSGDMSIPKQTNASQLQDLEKQNNQDSSNSEINQPQESSLKIQSEEVNKNETSEPLNEQITENKEQKQQQSSENISPLKQSNASQPQDLDKQNNSDQLNPQNNQLKQSPLKSESEEVDIQNEASVQLNEKINQNNEQKQQQSSENMSPIKQSNVSQSQDLEKQNNQDSQNSEKNQLQESPLKLEFEQADKKNNVSEQLNEQRTENNEQEQQQSSEDMSIPKQTNASQLQDLEKQNNNQDSSNSEINQPQESPLKLQSEEVNKNETSEQLNEKSTENNKQQQQQSSENISPLKQSNESQPKENNLEDLEGSDLIEQITSRDTLNIETNNNDDLNIQDGNLTINQQSNNQMRTRGQIPSFNSVDNQIFKNIDDQADEDDRDEKQNQLNKMQNSQNSDVFYSLKDIQDPSNNNSSNQYFTAEGLPFYQKSQSNNGSQNLINNQIIEENNDSRTILESIDEENQTPNHSNMNSRILQSSRIDTPAASTSKISSINEIPNDSIINNSNILNQQQSKSNQDNIDGQNNLFESVQIKQQNLINNSESDQINNSQQPQQQSSSNLNSLQLSSQDRFAPEISVDDQKLIDSELKDNVQDNLKTNLAQLKEESQQKQNEKLLFQIGDNSKYQHQLAQSILPQDLQNEQGINNIQNEQLQQQQNNESNQVELNKQQISLVDSNQKTNKKFETLMNQMEEQEKIFDDLDMIKFTEDNEEISNSQNNDKNNMILKNSDQGLENVDEKNKNPLQESIKNKIQESNENSNENDDQSLDDSNIPENRERQASKEYVESLYDQVLNKKQQDIPVEQNSIQQRNKSNIQQDNQVNDYQQQESRDSIDSSDVNKDRQVLNSLSDSQQQEDKKEIELIQNQKILLENKKGILNDENQMSEGNVKLSQEADALEKKNEQQENKNDYIVENSQTNLNMVKDYVEDLLEKSFEILNREEEEQQNKSVEQENNDLNIKNPSKQEIQPNQQEDESIISQNSDKIIKQDEISEQDNLKIVKEQAEDLLEQQYDSQKDGIQKNKASENNKIKTTIETQLSNKEDPLTLKEQLDENQEEQIDNIKDETKEIQRQQNIESQGSIKKVFNDEKYSEQNESDSVKQDNQSDESHDDTENQAIAKEYFKEILQKSIDLLDQNAQKTNKQLNQNEQSEQSETDSVKQDQLTEEEQGDSENQAIAKEYFKEILQKSIDLLDQNAQKTNAQLNQNEQSEQSENDSVKQDQLTEEEQGDSENQAIAKEYLKNSLQKSVEILNNQNDQEINQQNSHKKEQSKKELNENEQSEQSETDSVKQDQLTEEEQDDSENQAIAKEYFKEILQKSTELLNQNDQEINQQNYHKKEESKKQLNENQQSQQSETDSVKQDNLSQDDLDETNNQALAKEYFKEILQKSTELLNQNDQEINQQNSHKKEQSKKELNENEQSLQSETDSVKQNNLSQDDQDEKNNQALAQEYSKDILQKSIELLNQNNKEDNQISNKQNTETLGQQKTTLNQEEQSQQSDIDSVKQENLTNESQDESNKEAIAKEYFKEISEKSIELLNQESENKNQLPNKVQNKQLISPNKEENIINHINEDDDNLKMAKQYMEKICERQIDSLNNENQDDQTDEIINIPSQQNNQQNTQNNNNNTIQNNNEILNKDNLKKSQEIELQNIKDNLRKDNIQQQGQMSFEKYLRLKSVNSNNSENEGQIQQISQFDDILNNNNNIQKDQNEKLKSINNQQEISKQSYTLFEDNQDEDIIQDNKNNEREINERKDQPQIYNSLAIQQQQSSLSQLDPNSYLDELYKNCKLSQLQIEQEQNIQINPNSIHNIQPSNENQQSSNDNQQQLQQNSSSINNNYSSIDKESKPDQENEIISERLNPQTNVNENNNSISNFDNYLQMNKKTEEQKEQQGQESKNQIDVQEENNLENNQQQDQKQIEQNENSGNKNILYVEGNNKNSLLSDEQNKLDQSESNEQGQFDQPQHNSNQNQQYSPFITKSDKLAQSSISVQFSPPNIFEGYSKEKEGFINQNQINDNKYTNQINQIDNLDRIQNNQNNNNQFNEIAQDQQQKNLDNNQIDYQLQKNHYLKPFNQQLFLEQQQEEENQKKTNQIEQPVESQQEEINKNITNPQFDNLISNFQFEPSSYNPSQQQEISKIQDGFKYDNQQQQVDQKPDCFDQIIQKYKSLQSLESQEKLEKNQLPNEVKQQEILLEQQNDSNVNLNNKSEYIDQIIKKYNSLQSLDNLEKDKIQKQLNEKKSESDLQQQIYNPIDYINQIGQQTAPQIQQYQQFSSSKLENNNDQIDRIISKYSQQKSTEGLQSNDNLLKTEFNNNNNNNNQSVQKESQTIDDVIKKHYEQQQMDSGLLKINNEQQSQTINPYISTFNPQNNLLENKQIPSASYLSNENLYQFKSSELPINQQSPSDILDPSFLLVNNNSQSNLSPYKQNQFENQVLYPIDKLKDLARNQLPIPNSSNTQINNEQGFYPQKEFINLKKIESDVNERINNNLANEQSNEYKIQGQSNSQLYNPMLSGSRHSIEAYNSQLFPPNSPENIQANLKALREASNTEDVLNNKKGEKPFIIEAIENQVNSAIQDQSILNSYSQKRINDQQQQIVNHHIQNQILGTPERVLQLPVQEQVLMKKYIKIDPMKGSGSFTDINSLQQIQNPSNSNNNSRSVSPADKIKSPILQGVQSQNNIFISDQSNQIKLQNEGQQQQSQLFSLGQEQPINNNENKQLNTQQIEDILNRVNDKLSQHHSQNYYPSSYYDSPYKLSEEQKAQNQAIVEKGKFENNLSYLQSFSKPQFGEEQRNIDNTKYQNNIDSLNNPSKLYTLGQQNNDFTEQKQGNQNNDYLSQFGINDYQPMIVKSSSALDQNDNDNSRLTDNNNNKEISLISNFVQNSNSLPYSSTNYGVNSLNNNNINNSGFPYTGYTTPVDTTLIQNQSNNILPKSSLYQQQSNLPYQSFTNNQQKPYDQDDEEQEERKEMTINNRNIRQYNDQNNSFGSAYPFEMNKPLPSRDQSLESFKNSERIRGISPLMKPISSIKPVSQNNVDPSQINNQIPQKNDNAQDFLGSQHNIDQDLNNSLNQPNLSFISQGNVDFLLRPQLQQTVSMSGFNTNNNNNNVNFLDGLNSRNASRDNSFISGLPPQPQFYSQTSSPVKLQSSERFVYQSTQIQAQTHSVIQNTNQPIRQQNIYPHSAHHSPHQSRSEFKPVIKQTIIKQQVISHSTSQIMNNSQNSIASIDSFGNQIRSAQFVQSGSLPPQHPNSFSRSQVVSPQKQVIHVGGSQNDLNNSGLVCSPQKIITRVLHHSSSQLSQSIPQGPIITNVVQSPFVKVTQINNGSVIHHTPSRSQHSIGSVHVLQSANSLNDSVHSNKSGVIVNYHPPEIGTEVQRATHKQVIINPIPTSKTLIQQVVDPQNQPVYTNIIHQSVSKTPAILCEKDKLPSPQKPLRYSHGPSLSQTNLNDSQNYVSKTPQSLSRIGSSNTLQPMNISQLNSNQVSKTPYIRERTLHPSDIPKI